MVAAWRLRLSAGVVLVVGAWSWAHAADSQAAFVKNLRAALQPDSTGYEGAALRVKLKEVARRSGHIDRRVPPVLESSGPPTPQRPWVCRYTDWFRTTPCSAKCGGGYRYDIRTLLNKPPVEFMHNLARLVNCNEPTSRVETCNTQPCVVDCQLGEWELAEGGACSSSCGSGFQVWRRAIRMPGMNGGKVCDPVDSPNRLRVKECDIAACQAEGVEGQELRRALTPSVDLLTGSPLHVKTPCSAYCGGGTRFWAPLAELKTEQARVRWSETTCNNRACGNFEFYNAIESDIKPMRSKWFDLVIVFAPEEPADVVHIVLPAGFDVDKEVVVDRAGGGVHACRLLDHNLPRLESCEASTFTDGKVRMVFNFLNPLEPKHHGALDSSSATTRSSSPSYHIRINVKHPEACDQLVDETWNGTKLAVCGGRRSWTLLYFSFGEVGAIHGGYEVYTERPETLAVKPNSTRTKEQATSLVARFGWKKVRKKVWVEHPLNSNRSSSDGASLLQQFREKKVWKLVWKPDRFRHEVSGP